MSSRLKILCRGWFWGKHLSMITYIPSRMCLLIMPISDLLGLISLQVGLFKRSGLWSFIAMKESLHAGVSIWSSKPFEIKWKVLNRCRPYNNVSKKCNLCLHEKFVIMRRKDLCSLNKRNELASSCPHRYRYVLKNFVIT